jgi:glycosyltransferase involved in cell wall biosynthesis
MGHVIQMITPDLFNTFPCPTYPDIRLAFLPGRKIARLINAFTPDAIHVATEGTLGLAARNYCVTRGIPFTTSYATRFPEYINKRTCLPLQWMYNLMRWFHRPSCGIMVSTPSFRRELEEKQFRNIVHWTRGVDTEMFHPRPKTFLKAARPILMYVGRVAVEKNIEAFLNLDFKGTKYVIGDGPQLAVLRKKYPDVVFAGMKHGEELASYYAAADVFVFPSLTDTFGLVMLEALASGVPVAAFPVTGPKDVIGDSGVGILDENLHRAVTRALEIEPWKCREYALNYSWKTVSQLFLDNLHPCSR